MIACPLCKKKNVTFYNKSRDVEYFSTLKLYSYYECRKCEILFLLKPPKKISLIYPKSYYSYNNSKNNLYLILNLFKKFFDTVIFKNILKKIKKKNIYCLDVGGGSGWISKHLLLCDSRIKKITIVDIANNKNDVFKNNPKINFVKSRIENFKTKNKFDFILLLNLIEHVAEPDKILKKIKNLLNKNGICLVKTPNFDSFNNFLFKNLYWGGLHCPRHFIIFNIKGFHILCKKIKLKIIKYKFTQGFPQWHASIIGSLRLKKMSKEGIPIHKHFSWILILPFSILIDLCLLIWINKSDQVFYFLKK